MQVVPEMSLSRCDPPKTGPTLLSGIYQSGCEYEWGVHVAFFAERVGLTAAQVRSLTFGDGSDRCWVSERDRLLIEAVDSLHDSSRISDPLWDRLEGEFSSEEILDLTMMPGWYHAVSFTANGVRLGLEPGAPDSRTWIVPQLMASNGTRHTPRAPS